MEVETGGRLLSSALMTFGKQRAPSALEETSSICYRAQASNLILDRRNEIDIIYPTPNSLICYRNPQRTFSISTPPPPHPPIPIHRLFGARDRNKLVSCDQTKCSANVATQSEVI